VIYVDLEDVFIVIALIVGISLLFSNISIKPESVFGYVKFKDIITITDDRIIIDFTESQSWSQVESEECVEIGQGITQIYFGSWETAEAICNKFGGIAERQSPDSDNGYCFLHPNVFENDYSGYVTFSPPLNTNVGDISEDETTLEYSLTNTGDEIQKYTYYICFHPSYSLLEKEYTNAHFHAEIYSRETTTTTTSTTTTTTIPPVIECEKFTEIYNPETNKCEDVGYINKILWIIYEFLGKIFGW